MNNFNTRPLSSSDSDSLDNYQTPKRKKPFRFLFICLVVLLGVFLLSQTSSTTSAGFFGSIAKLLVNGDRSLKGEGDGRINILLLGMGGVAHEGPLLTDTIMLASIRPGQKDAALISLPRDLVIPANGYGLPKINSLNAYGETGKYPGGGAVFANNVLSKALNIPIHYYVRVDFDFFKQLVDDLGGISVTVERSFIDTQYPTDNFGYQTISFDKGTQEMDGETALKFVRSRHGDNEENSDFARAKRQQLVLEAIKNKGLSFGNLVNPSFIANTLENAQTNVSTNLEPWEIIKLGKIARDIDGHISRFVFTDSPGNFLTGSFGPDGGYILAPTKGDYSDIAKTVDEIFTLNDGSKEKVNIVLQNSTLQTGLAQYTASQLALFGYNVIAYGNASVRGQNQTMVYDMTNGKKSMTVKALSDWFLATTATTVPDIVVDNSTFTFLENGIVLDKEKDYIPANRPVDFLVVLGSDAGNNFQQVLNNQLKLLEQSKEVRAKVEIPSPQP
ncbi:MAG: LCP family protein [bacterium]